MELGLIGALVAACCFGMAAVLEAYAVRQEPTGDKGLDPTLLPRLLCRRAFQLGLALDLIGCVTLLSALRSLPLFLAQGMMAGSLAVSAVAGSRFLHQALHRWEWISVFTVCGGLFLLGISARDQNPARAGHGMRIALILALVALALAGLAATRLPRNARPAGLGMLGGLSFGVAGIATRVVHQLRIGSVIHDPASYVVVLAGFGAFVYYTAALKNGRVTVATALMVLGETVLPAIVGVVVLGDRTRHGFEPVALLGFVAAITGALSLARFDSQHGQHGEPPTPRALQATTSHAASR